MTATLNTAAGCGCRKFVLVERVTTKEKRAFFPLIMFFFPKAISEDKYRGKGRSIV